jgi:DNA repair exonuclease SbcCD ATPase subunit
MKKLFVLSMLIPLAMVCSCQKQNAAAEQQLAQRKAELDTREKALDEREKALADREKAVARATILPADRQLRALQKDATSNVPPSATIPPGLAPPDNSQLKASREKRIEELRALRQRRLETLQRMRSNMRAQPNSGAGAPADTSASGNTSGPSDASPSASPGEEATSPSPSSTPQ